MKKAMIRNLAAILVFITLISFTAACADGTTNTPDTQGTTEGQTTETAGETTKPETTEPVTTAPSTTEPVTTEPVTTEPATTEPATTEPVTTEPETTEPVTTEPETTEPATTAPPVTEPPETDPPETEPETTEEPLPQTSMPQEVTITNGFIFARVEEGSTVRLYNTKKELLYEARSQGGVFIGPVPHVGWINIRAVAEGKSESDGRSVYASAMADSAASGNSWAGKNSTLYYNGTYGFYVGGATVPGAEHLGNVKTHLENVLATIRGRTGKNTKLIIISVTNPATIYYDEQFDDPLGPGSILAETPTTAFVEYMKGHEDIYVVDAREALMAHKDELIFHQTDTHYTELGAYWCYRAMMDDYVLNDFPQAVVHPLSDYDINYVIGGKGDLTGIMGVNDFYECTPYLEPEFSSSLVGNIYDVKRLHSKVGIAVGTYPTYSEIAAPNNPTAYLLGDSYTANFALFASQAFSKLYINQGLMGQFYLDDLETKQPDYIVFVCTERNVGTDLSFIWANIAG